ncbi:MAG: glycerate kinase [Bifidobacteriaceae bacterium]|jgi:glycerate kinase|nr:glycerate kinase [Bifidobacteriaceae bacterium]
MRVVLAPDSFKGSLDALAAAKAMAAGVALALSGAAVELFPMADGGEGTVRVLRDAAPGSVSKTVQTTDALGRATSARYLMTADGVAMVELAEASGLPAVADRLSAGEATTLGTGVVVKDALGAGARQIVLFLGGSATSDGGAGILQALGARLTDKEGKTLEPGGAALARIDKIDLTGLMPKARAARWRLAVDVTNPLTGPRGAAAVFGPQKGASPPDVALLDRALAVWAQTLSSQVGPVDPTAPGLGAAGGTPAAIVAAFGAELTSGAELVAESTGLVAALPGADLLITGEGSFDAQSLDGKVVGTLAALAASTRVPVLVIAGSVAGPWGARRQAGIIGARSLADGPRDLAYLKSHAAELVTAATADALGTWIAGKSSWRAQP